MGVPRRILVIVAFLYGVVILVQGDIGLSKQYILPTVLPYAVYSSSLHLSRRMSIYSLVPRIVGEGQCRVIGDFAALVGEREIVRFFINLDGQLSAPALVFVDEIVGDQMACHLLVAAEEKFEEELLAIGDPIIFSFRGENELFEMVAFFIEGNLRAPVDLRLPWLWGAKLDKLLKVLTEYGSHSVAGPVDHPPLGYKVLFRFAAVAGGRAARVWLAGLLV